MHRAFVAAWPIVLVWTTLAHAAPTIPLDRHVEAAVAGHLSAPDDEPMHMPTDVAVDRAGRVYVADGANHRIVRFGSDGSFEAAITGAGGQAFSRPVGLTVDANDAVWIADAGLHRIVVLSRQGKLVEAIELPEGTRACDPTDVAVTADGARACIVDNDNHRLLVRDNRTGHIDVAGGAAGTGSELQWPFMVCLGRDGDAYITEVIGARVRRFIHPNRWVSRIGHWGVELGQFHRPKGVAVDRAGRVHVGDSTLGVVQVFDSSGRVVGVLANAGGEPLRFEHPMGMCFDSDGRLYVVELGANRVGIVALSATAATTLPATQPREGKR